MDAKIDRITNRHDDDFIVTRYDNTNFEITVSAYEGERSMMASRRDIEKAIAMLQRMLEEGV